MADVRFRIPDRFRFHEFTVETATGEIRRNGRRVRLQEKPFQLLLALLERPGEPVTREELRDRLWPGGLHVDFEQGLGNAVQKLRQALGDSAESPRYVETLPRRGYRFVAPLEATPTELVGGSQADVKKGHHAFRPPLFALAVVGVGALGAILLLVGTAFAPKPGNEARGVTRDPEAREAYLRARHFEEGKTPERMQKSVEYFRQAIEKDPQFALAWVGLSDSYRFLGALGLLPREEAFQRSSQAARRALELDETLAQAHASLAETAFRFGPPDADPEPGYLRALALQPDSATIRHWYANYLADRRNLDAALAEMRHAQRLDPLSLHINVDLGFLLHDAGLYTEASEQLRRTLELDPDYPKAHFLAGYVAWKAGRFEEAAARFRRVTELSPDTPKFLRALAVACMDAGRRDEAEATIQRIKSLQGQRHVEPEMVAQLERRLRSQRVSP